jgi:hypothetical protein
MNLAQVRKQGRALGKVSMPNVSAGVRIALYPITLDENDAANRRLGEAVSRVQKWSRLSEQSFRVDRWGLCRG